MTPCAQQPRTQEGPGLGAEGLGGAEGGGVEDSRAGVG